jgi:hypothetical protein
MLSGGILGLVTLALPMLVNWLKDNKHVTIEKEVVPKK